MENDACERAHGIALSQFIFALVVPVVLVDKAKGP